MSTDLLLQRICQGLVANHLAHTILLYGSRADGSATADSDYDIAAFAPIAAAVRDARRVDGSFIDVFIYPEAELSSCREDLLRLRNSAVLIQRGSEAHHFLTKLDELFRRGPESLPADEIAARQVWAQKMAERARRGDPEGDYRRVWLLYALLEDYFSIRGQWYQGPKKALKWLQAFDAATHAQFVAALAPGASQESLEALVHRVVREDDTPPRIQCTT